MYSVAHDGPVPIDGWLTPIIDISLFSCDSN